jgi:hypothetical protein
MFDRRCPRAGSIPSSRRAFRPSVTRFEPRQLLSGGFDVLTAHDDNARTGQDRFETALTPYNVNPARFGKLFTDPVDGNVYAQPLVKTGVAIPGQGVHDVVYVATEHDSVYAYDANHPGQLLWHDSFINPAAGVMTVPTLTPASKDMYPEIGITGTPVIDPSTGTMYVVAATFEIKGGAAIEVVRLHALDITDGAEKFGGPVVIQATVAGRGAGRDRRNRIAFEATWELPRPGLLLEGGNVYAAFGSLGDAGPFHGWVLGYNARTLGLAVAFNTTPNGNDGGIWQAGGGLAADEFGAIYAATGNGTYSAPRGQDFGDAIVKLAPGAGTARVLDSFSPNNRAVLAAKDLDFGSGGPVVLPTQPGATPHEIIAGGKDGTLYLVNRDWMGSGRNRPVNLVQAIPNTGKGLFATPAYFNNEIYVHAVGDVLKAYLLVGGKLVPTPISRSSQAFGYPGATPSISAAGVSNGIVWEIEHTGSRGMTGPAVLHPYNAANVAQELYNSSQAGGRDTLGPAVKFTVPTVANGKVYVGTQTGLSVFGEL